MPIYESDEHEFLNAKAKKIENNVYVKGLLFLTDKRVIFEKKGVRSAFRASPAIMDLNLFLYNVENANSAAPAFPLFTKQILTIEYYDDSKKVVRSDFAVKKAKMWVDQITRLATISKKDQATKKERDDLEKKRHELDMAKAKAPRANIGMAVFGNDKKTNPYENIRENMIDENNENLPDTALRCPHCGYPITDEMVYCPNCGYKLKSK
ncbi:zinc ribbon domain-containing protein [Ferroplasma sp.]|uniref:zinc ribbon domain-containing protein n=1 Tax=Ferroplasma sp. TaxID=2591003 RepID=UPI00307F178E